MSLAGANPLVTRRNGKIQACEPCRRRKVACDHGYPVCRRCKKRPNGESTCYYAPPDQDVRPGESTQSRQAVRGTVVTGVESAEAAIQYNRYVGRPEDMIWSSPASRAPRGFFGPTSFPAAYLEAERNLAAQGLPTAMIETAPSSPLSSTPPSAAEIEKMASMDQPANYLAVRVLQAIPERSSIASARFSVTKIHDGWIRRLGEELIMSTWDAFESYLQARTNLLKLRELGSMICINTRRSLKEDQDDSRSWIEAFSGPNLRWEAIGIIFLCMALSELSASPGTDSERRIAHYTEYCSSCITLANMGGSSGSLMLYLLYKRSVLHAYMHGEASLPYWKFHAETVAMLTFSGFHDDRSRESPDMTLKPMVAPEARRRVACEVFIVDKLLATFLGRPPLLSRRYCSVKLPLELSDAALFSDTDTFQTHADCLDPDGWDVGGQFHASSLIRVRMMVALIRDEILEFVLNHHGNGVVDDIKMLKIKELNLYNGLPTHVAYSTLSEGSRDMDTRTLYLKLLIRLDHLLNIYLIERLLVRLGCPRSDLLRTSFEMIILTLDIGTKKQLWAESPGEDQWIIMGYATLAGAVLCMDLINPDSTSQVANDEVIAGQNYSRSSVIQQLSLLVNYLSSLGSSQPKGSAASVRGVIKKVLDHILNAPRDQQTPTGWPSFDFTTDWDPDIFAQFNPLDTIDWLTENRT